MRLKKGKGKRRGWNEGRESLRFAGEEGDWSEGERRRLDGDISAIRQYRAVDKLALILGR